MWCGWPWPCYTGGWIRLKKTTTTTAKAPTTTTTTTYTSNPSKCQRYWNLNREFGCDRRARRGQTYAMCEWGRIRIPVDNSQSAAILSSLFFPVLQARRHQCQQRTTTKFRNGSHKNSVTRSSIMLLVFVCVAFVIACAYVDSMVGFAIRYTYANKLLIDSDCGVPAYILAHVSFIVFLAAFSPWNRPDWILRVLWEMYLKTTMLQRHGLIKIHEIFMDSSMTVMSPPSTRTTSQNQMQWNSKERNRSQWQQQSQNVGYVEIMHRLPAIRLHDVWVECAARRSQCVSTWKTIATHIPIYLIYYLDKFEGESEAKAKQEVLACVFTVQCSFSSVSNAIIIIIKS